MDELKVSRQLLLFLQEELLIISQKVDKRISPNFPDPSFISVGDIENDCFSSLNNKNQVQVNKNQVESWFKNEVNSINNNKLDDKITISNTSINSSSKIDKLSKYNSLITESDAFKLLNAKLIELNTSTMKKFEELKEELGTTALPSAIIEKSNNIIKEPLLVSNINNNPKITNVETNNIQEKSNDNIIINKDLYQLDESNNNNNNNHDENDNTIPNQISNHDVAVLINNQRRKANSKFESDLSSLNKGFDVIKLRMDTLEEDVRVFRRTILSEINSMKKLKRLNNGDVSIVQNNEVLEDKDDIILKLKEQVKNQNNIIKIIQSEELINNNKMKKLERNVEEINNKNILFESNIKLLQDQIYKLLNPTNINTIINENQDNSIVDENNDTDVDVSSKQNLNDKEKSIE